MKRKSGESLLTAHHAQHTKTRKMKRIKITPATALIVAAIFFASSCKKDNSNEPASLPGANNQNLSAKNSNAAGYRPFSDYLDAQGKTSIGVPPPPDFPLPDFIGFGEPIGPRPDYFSLFRNGSLDYNGTTAAYLASHGGPKINTIVTGSVMEIPLHDGRAKVTVKVHTENALTFAYTITLDDIFADPFYFLHAPLDFGYRASDLLADPSLTPSLGSSDFTMTFYNPAPGAAIPDMVDLVYTSRIVDVIAWSYQSVSSGTFHALSGFPEGSQGIVVNNQTAPFHVGFKDNHPVWVPVGTTNDGFPVERVTYKLR